MDDLSEPNRIPGDMGFRYDVRKIEGVEFAVSKELPGSTIDHEYMVVYGGQEFYGLIDQRRILPQEEGVKFCDGFEYELVSL
jgi:hypothetical protein